MTVPTLLLCRPYAQSTAFQEAVEAQIDFHFKTIISPAFRIEDFLPETPKSHVGPLIFTSVQGVKSAVKLGYLPPRLAYCVGETTAKAAAQVGFQVRSADGNSEDLLRLLLSEGSNSAFVHISGQHITGDLVGDLQANGITAERVIAYKQVPEPPSEDFKLAVEGTGYAVLPLFSPRSALIIKALRVGENKRIVAMSDNVASAIVDIGRATISVVDRPTFDIMLKMVCQELKNAEQNSTA